GAHPVAVGARAVAHTRPRRRLRRRRRRGRRGRHLERRRHRARGGNPRERPRDGGLPGASNTVLLGQGRRRLGARLLTGGASASLGLGFVVCGVFGIRAPERDVARVTHFALHALQHRGQESAGIAVSDRGRLTVLRDMGLVTQVFTEQKLRGLTGDLAIGHTRYSTTGSTEWANAQPIVQHGRARTVALGHNGNLTNAEEVRAELASEGVRLTSSSDTELIAALIAHDPAPLNEAVAHTMERLDGAYSVTALSEGKLLAFR